jgi:hypothetical protein
MLDRQMLIERFGELLPLAASWAAAEEERILQDGLPLSPASLRDARALGVRLPERVRWQKVETIPRPVEEVLKLACDAIQFLGPETQGLTLGHGIFIRADRANDRDLVAHELVHVVQYERMGGIRPFLEQYLMECLTVGYGESPLEQEAILRSARLR